MEGGSACDGGADAYEKVEVGPSGACEYHARIELSTKVLDTAELEATLLHEMCHAAAWLLDHCDVGRHARFSKMGQSRMLYPVDRRGPRRHTLPDSSVLGEYRCTQSWCQHG